MPTSDKRVIWTPRAKQDILLIWRYFADVATPETADNLLHEINSGGMRLTDKPLLGRTREEVAPGLRSILVHPYVVSYRLNNARIEIVRVLHERRNFQLS